MAPTRLTKQIVDNLTPRGTEYVVWCGNPRSLLDVHHKNPLDEGKRYTTLKDFALLCPTCHRVEHQRLRHGLSRHGTAANP